jgi:hypothetical protein
MNWLWDKVLKVFNVTWFHCPILDLKKVRSNEVTAFKINSSGFLHTFGSKSENSRRHLVPIEHGTKGEGEYLKSRVQGEQCSTSVLCTWINYQTPVRELSSQWMLSGQSHQQEKETRSAVTVSPFIFPLLTWFPHKYLLASPTLHASADNPEH